MKIAILGANGFIGSSLSTYLSRTHQVVPVTRAMVDLTNSLQVRDLLKQNMFDVVIHCAASKMLDQSLITDTRNNLGSFINLYNNSDLFGKLINFGTGAEFVIDTDIIEAREETIFDVMPTESYGFGHNMKSRLCHEKDNFYTLRIFGCFGLREISKRLIPKFIASKEEFNLELDRYFDYFSIQDLCAVTDSFIGNNHIVRDVNCVYNTKLKVSEILNKFKELHNINTKINVVSTSPINYTGSSQRIDSLGISLKGLDNGILKYFNDV